MKKKLFKRFLPLCLMLSLGLGFCVTSNVNAKPSNCKDSPNGEHCWKYKGGDINGRNIYQCDFCGVFSVD